MGWVPAPRRRRYWALDAKVGRGADANPGRGPDANLEGALDANPAAGCESGPRLDANPGVRMRIRVLAGFESGRSRMLKPAAPLLAPKPP